jgi:hypothetical protein
VGFFKTQHRMSSLIRIPSSEARSRFALPSHFTVGPTAAEPSAPMLARRVWVKGCPLPLYEDFELHGDAFDGKSFVRFPLRNDTKVMGCTARLRNEQPPFDSFWLPHHCIVGNNSLEAERLQRSARLSAASLRGVGSSSVTYRS